MNTTISRKTAYIGAGAGLVLFALFGLMPGSLIGGAAGIGIAGWLFGLPLQPAPLVTDHCPGVDALRRTGGGHRDCDCHLYHGMAHRQGP